MIVLLSYSTNLLANDSITSFNHSTGDVVVEDSILISYDDLKIVNSKLIELEYEKEINSNLRNIIINKNEIITNYNTINSNLQKSYKKTIRQRNIAIGSGTLFLITALLLILK